jgi:hypothetical protein
MWLPPSQKDQDVMLKAVVSLRTSIEERLMVLSNEMSHSGNSKPEKEIPKETPKEEKKSFPTESQSFPTESSEKSFPTESAAPFEGPKTAAPEPVAESPKKKDPSMPDCFGVSHDGSTKKCKLCANEFMCEQEMAKGK